MEKFDDSGIEADVCATNEGVIRYCKRCGCSTLWKPALSLMNQESVPAPSSQLPLFSPSRPCAFAFSTPARLPLPRCALHFSRLQSFPIGPAAAALRRFSRACHVVFARARARDAHFRRLLASAPSSAPILRLFRLAATLPPSSVPASSTSQSAFTRASRPLTLPPPEKPAAPASNRRKHSRVKVAYSACIRHYERGDEIVQCEDMSKGGLRFKSPKRYYERSLIEVAVPYQPGQPAIFVPAQIVYVEELPEQQLFRCGVSYIKSTKPRGSF